MKLIAIGRIGTVFKSVEACPPNIDDCPEPSVLELEPEYAQALKGLGAGRLIQVIYWFDRADRDRLVQKQRHTGMEKGTFALRSPNRPNPLGLSEVTILSIDGAKVTVSGLDCVDGTALVDIKPVMA